jgi:hypothetical protein
MTCPTAARIARGYDEAPSREVAWGNDVGKEVVDVPRKYGMAEMPRWAQPTPTWDEAVSYANDNRTWALDDLIGKAVYVATPYTKYGHGHAAAAYDAAEVTARLIDYGLSPLSPIAHSHAVATVGRLDKVDGELWQRVDAPWVRVAEACVVVKMPGWEESAGVQHEIAEFTAAGKPVVYLDWGMG